MSEGPVCLVTGAGQGIGRSIAHAVGAAGYLVAVNDVNAESARATSQEITSSGGRAEEVPADVGDLAATRSLLESLAERHGRLDALVNNAGLIRPNQFGDVTEEDWDATFRVNARGLFFLLQAAAAQMVSQGGGSIVNVASIVGRGAPTTSPPYAASKAAVISLTQSAARALAAENVRVNAVCPGVIDTPFNWALDQHWGVSAEGLAKGEYLARSVTRIPMGRMAHPNEVAAAVVFLLSDAASYITGQAINVDGGILFN